MDVIILLIRESSYVIKVWTCNCRCKIFKEINFIEGVVTKGEGEESFLRNEVLPCLDVEQISWIVPVDVLSLRQTDSPLKT